MKQYFAEFLGTLFFLYVILATGNAIAAGIALAIATIISGPISGGHLNPAVTVMMFAAKKIPSSEIMPYVLAQVLGGLTAFELFKRVKITK
jgi:aquaporin Z